MIRYTEGNGEQYTSIEQQPNDTKSEDDDIYLQNLKNKNLNFEMQQNNDKFYGFFASSMSSLPHDNMNGYEYDNATQNNMRCVRGVQTIIKNPHGKSNGGIKKKKKKMKNNESLLPKEKDRARLFNDAFDKLRGIIPSIPASKKLSKIEILRLAICYMAYLKFLIEFDIPTRYTNDDSDSDSINMSQITSESSMDKIDDEIADSS